MCPNEPWPSVLAPKKMHKQINLVGTRKVPVVYPWKVPPVANQIDLFMHFLGASRDSLVARPVEMDKLSSSDIWIVARVS